MPEETVVCVSCCSTSAAWAGRGKAGAAVGCATRSTAVGDGCVSNGGKLGFPEHGNPNRRKHILLIGYNLEPPPSLAFTCTQLSFMIPKDFSKWKEIIVSHPPKKPLPEAVGPQVWLRPRGRKHRETPLPRQVGASHPEGGVVISIFSTVREGFSLSCFKWQFL